MDPRRSKVKLDSLQVEGNSVSVGVLQESTGISPFELLYGRRVRGPLDVLEESWTGCCGEETSAIAHVVEMRNSLEQMSELVKRNMEKAQSKQKTLYDRKAKARNLEAGDNVLVLLPMQQNRLKLEWVGPYTITRKVTLVDYEVGTPGDDRRRRSIISTFLRSGTQPNLRQGLCACLLTQFGRTRPWRKMFR